jgi:hypothetical protein
MVKKLAMDVFGRALTARWTDKLAALVLARLVIWVAVAVYSHEGILTEGWKLADWMDDHQFYAWEEADRMTLLRWGQLPAWNPYWCGGTIGIGAPEDPFLGPDFIFRLIFGVAHGRRLAIVFLVIMGFEGTYRLCRRLDSSAVAAAFAAVVYGTCDKFVGFLHDGWVNFLGFELIPWVLLCLVNGLSSWRWRLLGGFFFAWIVMSAGTYPTPFTLLAVGYFTVALSVRGFFSREPRAWLAPWISAATIGVVALGVCFGKLVPTLSFLAQFPRVFTPVETHAVTDLFGQFWFRYGVFLVLAFVGAITADVAAGICLGGALLFFALAMGDFGEYSPFHLLKSLPIFKQLRFPDRYMVVVLLFTSVSAARGITRLEDALPALVRTTWERVDAALRSPGRGMRWLLARLPKKWQREEAALQATGAAREVPRELVWVAVGLAAWLAYDKGRPHVEEILAGVRIKPGTMYVQEAPRAYAGEFKQHRGNRRDAHVFPPMNMGTIYCVAGNPLPESPRLRGDLAQEEYPEDPSKATVKRLAWSPNAIDLEVDAREPATIFVNQNWAPAWKSDVGTVRSVDKLLAVDVPAGKHVVRLAYRDGFLLFCLGVSAASLLALAFVFGRDGVRWLRAEAKAWNAMPWWPDQAPRGDETDGEGERSEAERSVDA